MCVSMWCCVVSAIGSPCRYSGQDENVRANLRQYRLEGKYIDMLVADAANPPWKPQEVFDAVVTDRKMATCTVWLGNSLSVCVCVRVCSSVWHQRRWAEGRL